MKHAPATVKGRRRRFIVLVAENVIGIAFIFGALYVFCAFAKLVETFVGVG